MSSAVPAKRRGFTRQDLNAQTETTLVKGRTPMHARRRLERRQTNAPGRQPPAATRNASN